MRAPSRVRSLAVACATVLLLAACASDDPTIDLADAPDDLLEEPADEPEPEPEPEPADEPDPEPADEPEPAPDATPSATPDAALVADPCGPHAGREGEAFIALASPVDGQDLGDGADVAFVGCSNVFEATVVWELRDGDTVLAEGFLTAECGSGCVGAFSETIDLTAGAGRGELELHAVSPDMSDGEGSDLREIVTVTVG